MVVTCNTCGDKRRSGDWIKGPHDSDICPPCQRSLYRVLDQDVRMGTVWEDRYGAPAFAWLEIKHPGCWVVTVDMDMKPSAEEQ